MVISLWPHFPSLVFSLMDFATSSSISILSGAMAFMFHFHDHDTTWSSELIFG